MLVTMTFLLESFFTGLYEQNSHWRTTHPTVNVSFHDGIFHQVDTFEVRNLSQNLCLRLTHQYREYIFLYVLPSGSKSKSYLNGLIKVQLVLYDLDPFITLEGYDSFIRII